MINETILNNFTLPVTKAQSCLSLTGMSDQCLYEMLCKPMSKYFVWVGLGLLALDVLVSIVEYIYKKKNKGDDLKIYKFLFACENHLKFSMILYVIVVIYYAIV